MMTLRNMRENGVCSLWARCGALHCLQKVQAKGRAALTHLRDQITYFRRRPTRR